MSKLRFVKGCDVSKYIGDNTDDNLVSKITESILDKYSSEDGAFDYERFGCDIAKAVRDANFAVSQVDATIPTIISYLFSQKKIIEARDSNPTIKVMLGALKASNLPERLGSWLAGFLGSHD